MLRGIGVTCLLLMTLQSHAAPTHIYPVGKHGGARLFFDCKSKNSTIPCMLDTGAVNSTFYKANYNKGWTAVSRSFHEGFAFIDCEVVIAKDFYFGGLVLNGQSVCRTEMEIMRQYGVHIGSGILRNVSYSLDLRHPFAPSAEISPSRILGSKMITNFFDKRPSAMADIEGAGFDLVFDTGTPVTLVHSDVVKKFPEVFQITNIDPPQDLKDYSVTVYRLKGKLRVGSVLITGGYIYAADLSKFWGTTLRPMIFLGMNHMIGKKWEFSPATSSWMVWE